jgi:hypothetical protein
MPDIRLVLPRPHEAQQVILREAKRYNVLACLVFAVTDSHMFFMR